MAQDAGTGAAFVTGGAATGAGVNIAIGNMGLAFNGTAVRLGFTPIVGAGVVAGAASYGIFEAMVEGDASAIFAAAAGGLGGAAVSLSVGGMGLAFKGTAISLGITPVTLAGGVIGLGVYGFLKLIDKSGSGESAAQVFSRMADKIDWQDTYTQALLELNPTWAEMQWLQKLAAVEVQEELEAIKAELRLKQQCLGKNWILLENVEVDFIPSSSNDDLLTDATISLQPISSWQCVQEIKAHLAAINSFAISQDGKSLASASNDKTIRWWNLETGHCLYTFYGHSQEVYAVAMSSDGKRVVSGSFDNKITSWNLEKKSIIQTFFDGNSTESHKGFVYTLAFSPNQKVLISGSADKTIKFWGMLSGQLIKVLKGHTDFVLAVAMSADGQTLISGSADKTIRIWELSNNLSSNILGEHAGWVRTIAISPDSNFLVSGSEDKTIKLWNLTTKTLTNTLTGHSAGVLSVAISPDGKHLASASRDGMIYIWNLATGEVLQSFLGGHTVTYSADGKTLVTGCDRGTIKVWQQRPKECNFLTGEWWEVLQIHRHAEFNEVKQAYRRLARQYHPDMNTSANAKGVMQALNQAYQKAAIALRKTE